MDFRPGERRILIDCASISDLTPVTGIPRVVYNYIKGGYRFGRANGISVLPVYIQSQQILDARPNLPEWTHDAPLFGRTAAELAGIEPRQGREASKPFEAQQRHLKRYGAPIFNLIARPAAALVGDSLITQLRTRYGKWRQAETFKRMKMATLTVRPGDIVFMPAYWHDEYPSSYRAAQRAGAVIVPLLHDVLPITIPEHYNEGWREEFRENVLSTFSFCDHAMCISTSTQNEIRKIALESNVIMPPSSIHYHGFDFSHDDSEINDKNINSDFKTFFSNCSFSIVCVGSIEPKKNHKFLLDACKILWDTGNDFNLAIIGRPGWKSDDTIRGIEQHMKIEPRIKWFRSATDAELNYAYQHANICVLPSMAEGFGLPLIEALTRKLPVLASDIPPFREISGTSAEFFDHSSQDSLCDALTRLINDPGAYADLAARAKGFQWRSWEMASDTLFSQLLEIVPRCRA
jgi:glycosyltransferase involved in cell wall biosynthesis